MLRKELKTAIYMVGKEAKKLFSSFEGGNDYSMFQDIKI